MLTQQGCREGTEQEGAGQNRKAHLRAHGCNQFLLAGNPSSGHANQSGTPEHIEIHVGMDSPLVIPHSLILSHGQLQLIKPALPQLLAPVLVQLLPLATAPRQCQGTLEASPRSLTGLSQLPAGLAAGLLESITVFAEHSNRCIRGL